MDWRLSAPQEPGFQPEHPTVVPGFRLSFLYLGSVLICDCASSHLPATVEPSCRLNSSRERDVSPVPYAEILRVRRHIEGHRRGWRRACLRGGQTWPEGHHAPDGPLALPQAFPQPGTACGRGLYGRAHELRGRLRPSRLPDALLPQPLDAGQLPASERVEAHLAGREEVPAGE